MTVPFKTKLASCAVAAVAGFTPVAASADATNVLDTPTIVFSFSGLGAPQLEELPLEISDDSTTAPVRAPVKVVDLGTTPLAVDVATTRAPRRVIQNTWTIGVFR